jgi:hypothetical protein
MIEKKKTTLVKFKLSMINTELPKYIEPLMNSTTHYDGTYHEYRYGDTRNTAISLFTTRWI